MQANTFKVTVYACYDCRAVITTAIVFDSLIDTQFRIYCHGILFTVAEI